MDRAWLHGQSPLSVQLIRPMFVGAVNWIGCSCRVAGASAVRPRRRRSRLTVQFDLHRYRSTRGRRCGAARALRTSSPVFATAVVGAGRGANRCLPDGQVDAIVGGTSLWPAAAPGQRGEPVQPIIVREHGPGAAGHKEQERGQGNRRMVMRVSSFTYLVAVTMHTSSLFAEFPVPSWRTRKM